ncbi:hypothetical protein Ancab_011225 [Ancistrocladus abbreviatus]
MGGQEGRKNKGKQRWKVWRSERKFVATGNSLLLYVQIITTGGGGQESTHKVRKRRRGVHFGGRNNSLALHCSALQPLSLSSKALEADSSSSLSSSLSFSSLQAMVIPSI